MRGNRFSLIGPDRLLRLQWLEKSVDYVFSGYSTAECRALMREDLKGFFRNPNTKTPSSLDKTVTMMTKIWLGPAKELRALHEDALTLLQTLPRKEQLAIHWGMTMAAYPFWANVALYTGRLIRLQGNLSQAQVQRRIKEKYGEQSNISRRVSYALRSMIDWKVISDTKTQGVYQPAKIQSIDNPKVAAWLVEALLHSRSSGSSPLKEALNSPSLFPFQLPFLSVEQIDSSASGIETLRHGLDMDLVMLKKRSSFSSSTKEH